MRGTDVPVPVMEPLPPALRYFRYATRITLSSYAGGPSILGVSLGEPMASEEKISFGRDFISHDCLESPSSGFLNSLVSFSEPETTHIFINCRMLLWQM